MKSLYLTMILLLIHGLLSAQQVEATSNTNGDRVIKAVADGAQAWAVYGEATGFNGHGVVGIANGDQSRGVYGVGDIAIYGSASTGAGLAGLFVGDVEIDGLNKGLTFPDDTKQTTAFQPQSLFYMNTFLTGPIAANSSNNVNCFCDEGDIATGGGWDAYQNETGIHNSTSNTYYNRPASKLVNGKITGGWQIGFRNNSSEFYRIKVYVICADVN